MENDTIQRLKGLGIEVGGGIATDVLTGALLNPLTLKATAGLSGLAYGAINFGQGAYTNYLVQKHLYQKRCGVISFTACRLTKYI